MRIRVNKNVWRHDGFQFWNVEVMTHSTTQRHYDNIQSLLTRKNYTRNTMFGLSAVSVVEFGVTILTSILHLVINREVTHRNDVIVFVRFGVE